MVVFIKQKRERIFCKAWHFPLVKLSVCLDFKVCRLAEIFFFCFLHRSNYLIYSWIRQLIRIFSKLIKLMWSLIHHQLKICWVSLQVNSVNIEWDSKSTESTQNDKVFMNTVAICVAPVDVEYHSALTLCAGIQNQLWQFKGTTFREKKMYNETFKWVHIDEKMLTFFT